jgi:DNA recombination protein RmuC
MNLTLWIVTTVLTTGAGILTALFLVRSQNRRAQLELEIRLKDLSEKLIAQSSSALGQVARSELSRESEVQKTEIKGLVAPLAEALEKFKGERGDTESKRQKEYGNLDRFLKSMVESNEKLKTETHNLVNALKRPTVRGRWGEIQLRRVVELSGMSEHVDFQEQASSTSDDGRLRPDLIVKLPGGRQIIVDSKAVLQSYLEAEEAQNESDRKLALTRHALALKTRIQELSRKNYWDQFSKAPEFVVLFIPGEAFFSAALQESPDLIENGFDQKVILATPTTLMALLRAVAFGWRQESLADNARLIADSASKLYQALGVWTGHLADVEQGLERATKAFNNAVGSLERNVLPSARKMKELGVSSKTELTELKGVETSLRKPEPLPGPAIEG